MRKMILLVCISGVLALAGPSWAQTAFTWDNDGGTGDGRWLASDNWNPNGLPDYELDDTVIIKIADVCTVDAAGAEAKSGAVTGGHLVIDGPAAHLKANLNIYGNGLIELKQGTHQNTGEIMVGRDSGGTYNNSGGTLTSSYLVVGGNGTSADADIYLSGTGVVTTGRVRMIEFGGGAGHGNITQSGTTSFTCSSLYINAGSAGSTATYQIDSGSLTCSGYVGLGGGGDGTLHVIGADPVITFGDDIADVFLHKPTGTLKCEIGGAGVGTVQVAGTATFEFGGTVQVTRLASAPPPEKGDYDILTATGGITNNGLGLTYDSTFWNVTVGLNDITATFKYIPGDCALFPTTNNDVDDADLSVLLNNFSKTGMTWADGDFTNNGGVDDADLSVLLAHWDTVAAVPEPATLVLLGVGLVGVILRRRRA